MRRHTRFLLAAYEKEPGDFGPQTLYFLACLAGGAGMPGCGARLAPNGH